MLGVTGRQRTVCSLSAQHGAPSCQQTGVLQSSQHTAVVLTHPRSLALQHAGPAPAKPVQAALLQASAIASAANSPSPNRASGAALPSGEQSKQQPQLEGVDASGRKLVNGNGAEALQQGTQSTYRNVAKVR